MKGPSLQKTAALSAVLHLTVFILAALVLRQSDRFSMPSAYTVNLVSPAGKTHGQTSRGDKAVMRTKSAEVAKKDAVSPDRETKKSSADEITEKRLIESRIAEIAAIERIKKRLGLREMVSVKKKGDQSGSKLQPAGVSGTPGAETGDGSYADKIASEIGDKLDWAGDKELETIISVRISRDGSIKIIKMEKKSGNSFFDKQALRAIAKASPVAPPPYDFVDKEIGLRFYPPGSYQ